MNPAQKRQIRNEMIAGAAVNAVLSLAAAWLVFGGMDSVPYCCAVASLAVDAAPHGFAISFMATLVPSLFVLGRIRKGRVEGCPPAAAMLPGIRGRIAARAIAAGGIGGLAGISAHLAMVGVAPPHWPLAAVLLFKPVYGVAVSLAATGIALRLLFAQLSAAAPGTGR